MTARTHEVHWAYRLGRGARRLWRGYQTREAGAARWLVARGVPATAVQASLLVAKLLVAGAALFSMAWLALLLGFLVAAAWIVRNDDSNEIDSRNEAKWRDGWDGYGLYRGGFRIDGGSADDE